MKVARYLMMVLFGGIVGGFFTLLLSISSDSNIFNHLNFANNNTVLTISIIGSIINILLFIVLVYILRNVLKYKNKIRHGANSEQEDLYEEKANLNILKSNFITYLSVLVALITLFIVALGKGDFKYIILAFIPLYIMIIISILSNKFIQKFDSRMPKTGEKNYIEKTLNIMDEGERHITLVSMYKIYQFNIVLLMIGAIILSVFSIRTGINQSPGILILILLFCYNTFGYIFKLYDFYKQ